MSQNVRGEVIGGAVLYRSFGDMILDAISTDEGRARVQRLIDSDSPFHEPKDERPLKVLFAVYAARPAFLARQGFAMEVHFASREGQADLCGFIELPKADGIYVWEGVSVKYEFDHDFVGQSRLVTVKEWDLFSAGQHPFESISEEIQAVRNKRRAALMSYWACKDAVATTAKELVQAARALQDPVTDEEIARAKSMGFDFVPTGDVTTLRSTLIEAVDKMNEALELLCD